MFKSKKIIIILSCITASLLLIVSILFSAFFLKTTAEKRKNQKAADIVISHIEQLNNSNITLENENIIMTIKTEYDLLTDKQKALVTNYILLEKYLCDLQNLKDKQISEELIDQINRINKNTLTADNTSVYALIDKYDSLTPSQKSLVNNYDLLIEYKNIVDKKIAELEQKNKGIELAQKFEAYDGKWGNFGAHINEYQGMIEAALHNDVNYKKYFSTPANSLKFHISRFIRDETVFGIGVCYYTFNGTDKEYNYEGTLHGEIIIKEDGSLYATINGYY